MSRTRNLGKMISGNANLPTAHIDSDFTVHSNLFHVDADTDRVGIGETSPDAKLHIRDATDGGSGSVTSAIQFSRRNGGANDAAIKMQHDGSDGVSNLQFHFGADERVRLTSLGNVGIGTSSPSSPLVVAEGTGQHGFEVQPGTLTYVFAYDRATADYGDLDIAGQTLRFSTDNGAERARIDANGGIEHKAPDGQNGEAYRTRYSSGSSNIVKVNEAIGTGAGGNQDLWFRIFVPQDYYNVDDNGCVLTVSAINLAQHATGSGIFQKVICIGTNHGSSYNAAVSTLINSKSSDSYYSWTNTLEFYRNNDTSSDAVREVTYIKARGGSYTNFLLNVEGWIRYGNRLTLTFLGTTAPSNITLVG